MNLFQKISYLSLLLLFTSNLAAQKILQIEKVGSDKLVRFYIGQELTFKLKNAPGWFTRRINDIDAEKQLVLFEEKGFININDIEIIQQNGSKAKRRAIGQSLYIFGINWGFWSLASTLIGDELSWSAAIVPAAAFVLGFLIQRIGRGKVWKMGRRRYLRVLDLNFSMAVA